MSGKIYPEQFRAFVTRLRTQLPIAETEFAPLASLDLLSKHVGPKTKIYHEGDTEQCLYVVASGWLMGYSMLPDGARYIHRLYQAGDLVGTEDTNWNYATSSVETLTDCVIGAFRKEDQYKIFSGSLKLGAALYGLAMNDQVMIMDTARANQRLLAADRIGHFLLQIEARQNLTSQTENDGFLLPISQAILADCVGLSLVHVNRSLKSLEDGGVLRRDGQHYRIEKRRELVERTGFINRYDVTQPEWLKLMAS